MDGTLDGISPATTSAQPHSRPVRQGRVEMSVAQIIERAENKPASFLATLGLSICGGLLSWASFPPLDWAFLAWLAPLPLLMLIRVNRPSRGMYVATWLGGLAFTVPVLQWMRYGDPLMYIGWIALACYVACYAPLFVGLCRLGLHRWGWPLLVVAPVVWTGLEYLRGFLLTGFGWYFLGHTQYRWLSLIQISDITGAYGVSFVMMMFAAVICLQLPDSLFQRLGLLPRLMGEANVNVPTVIPAQRPQLQLMIAVCLLLSCVGYGAFRLQQENFQSGPRVALIQGNFRAQLQVPPDEFQESFLVHNELTGYAVEHQPDLIVWPEGMFRYPLQLADEKLSAADLKVIAPYFPPDSWRQTDVQHALQTMSEKAGAALVIGLGTYEIRDDSLAQYNSAQFISPDQGLRQRYDKIHRVPFGEYIPGKDWPVLSSLIPPDFGLTAGEKAVVFEHAGWRFAPVICFEDTVPHVARKIVSSIEQQSVETKPIDFLVNLSNDGWFDGSSEHDQHLITAQFRSIELRKPLVRAANMGISSVINGSGEVIEPEVFLTKDAVSREKRPESFRDPETGRYRKQLEAVLVQTIPLDDRNSFYLQWGDWFAAGCFWLTVGLFASYFFPRRPDKSVATV